MLKRVLGLLLCAVLALGGFANALAAVDYNSARHYRNADTGDVFLGGKYMEVGVSNAGSFGTESGADPVYGFHGGRTTKGASGSTSSALGLVSDADGWDVGEESKIGDVFLPGTQEERWIINYTLGGVKKVYVGADRMHDTTASDFTSLSTQDNSDSCKSYNLCAKTTAVTADNVTIIIETHFNVMDSYYTTDVQVINNSDQELTDVRFCRFFDPDQDVWLHGTYETYNKVICNPDRTKAGSVDNCAMVVAAGKTSLQGIFFLCLDNRSFVSHGHGFGEDDLYQDSIWSEAHSYAHKPTNELIAFTASDPNGYVSADKAIAMTVNFGSIAAGAGDAANFLTSLDGDVLGSLDKIHAALGKIEPDTRSIVINDVEEGFYYRLVSEDGSFVTPWQQPDAEGNLIFTGLTPDTKYSIEAVENDKFNGGAPDAGDIDDSLGDTTTKIDTSTSGRDPVTGQPADIIVTPGCGLLTFANLDTTTYTYTLTLGGTTIAANVQNGFVAGLKSGTTYTLTATRTDNTASVSSDYATGAAHQLALSAAGGVLTERCTVANCEYSATATLTAPTNLLQDGTAKEATLTYSDAWESAQDLVIDYTGDNVNGGIVTASITKDGQTAVVRYTLLYSIAVQAEGNGTATASLATAEPGAAVTLTVSPSANHYFKEFQVTPADLTIADDAFTMPAAHVQIKAVFVSSYKFLYGEGQNVPHGGEAAFGVDGPLSKFAYVSVDGQVLVENTDYTVVGGTGTDLTLGIELIKTLAPGEHALEVGFTDGMARTTFNVFPAPTAGITITPGCGFLTFANLDDATYTYALSQGTTVIEANVQNGVISGLTSGTVYTLTATRKDNGVSASTNYTTLSAHQLAFTAAGGVLTERCTAANCEYSAAATLTAPTDLLQDGTAKEATLTYSDAWESAQDLVIEYTGDNVNGGIVTASITKGDQTASVRYTLLYSITVTPEGNGTVTASLATAEPGAAVTLTVTPSANHYFKELQVTPADLVITDDAFTMPAAHVQIKAVFVTSYPFLYGERQNVFQGGEAGFGVDAPSSKLTYVSVDGQVLTQNTDYMLENESLTEFKLTSALTKTLALGEHALEVGFSDGMARTTFTMFPEPTEGVGVITGCGFLTFANLDTATYTYVLTQESTFVQDNVQNGTIKGLKSGTTYTLTATRKDNGVSSSTNYTTETDHQLEYAAENGVLTESCTVGNCDYTATATLTAPANLIQDGTAKEAALTYSDAWESAQDLTIAYDGDNVNGSEVTASITKGGQTASVTYDLLYTVTVQVDGHGTASASHTAAAAGTTITLTIAPDDGYLLKELQFTPASLTFTSGAFTMPAAHVQLTAVFHSDYPFLSGAEQTVPYKSEAHFVVDGPLSKFAYVRVDGQLLTLNSDYTVYGGTTTGITLSWPLLYNLGHGIHSLEVGFTDGVATTTFTVLSRPLDYPPATGDNTPLGLAGSFLVFSVLGMLTLSRKRRLG